MRKPQAWRALLFPQDLKICGLHQTDLPPKELAPADQETRPEFLRVEIDLRAQFANARSPEREKTRLFWYMCFQTKVP